MRIILLIGLIAGFGGFPLARADETLKDRLTTCDQVASESIKDACLRGVLADAIPPDFRDIITHGCTGTWRDLPGSWSDCVTYSLRGMVRNGIPDQLTTTA